MLIIKRYHGFMSRKIRWIAVARHRKSPERIAASSHGENSGVKPPQSTKQHRKLFDDVRNVSALEQQKTMADDP